ncbi:hypothetical protein K0O13_01560 [Mammaliicoccus sciuri]|uniref:hypothetical protein n=1 Tax=Mammaliicoccus sciuri TaxID=1296 RepID=UPI001C62FECC|nr:hypothetical protein [Mammaliicoccus sciuri]QYG31617.1 hypothetical protein K0O13_01560 [Mammaliicoccus sciuri]
MSRNLTNTNTLKNEHFLIRSKANGWYLANKPNQYKKAIHTTDTVEDAQRFNDTEDFKLLELNRDEYEIVHIEREHTVKTYETVFEFEEVPHE